MKYGVLALIAVARALHRCGAPGRRARRHPSIRPSEVADFRVLYRPELLGMPRREMDRER